MSGTAGDRAQRGPDGDSLTGPPCYGSRRPVPAAPAAGRRPQACPHVPACPPPRARDCLAARVIAGHPEQGWSLLCNGVVTFEDTGALLPDRSVIEPDRGAWQAGANGVTQAGHAWTVAPVPAGRAREGELHRPVLAMAGVAVVASPSGTAPGWRQHAVRLHARRAPAQAVLPARGLQQRVAVDAW
jgi:hypothetical protein